MSNLHAYFHLRNLGAFRQLLDARGVSGNRPADGRPDSGPRSWSQQAQTQMTAITQGGQLDNNPNTRDALGRTVLHLACADLAPIALEFVRALLALPSNQIGINIQDTESGWTALHRALYAGNLPAAVLLLTRSDIDTGIRDLEGMTSFDVYNATVEGTVPDGSISLARELLVWGSNRNATLGIGSADDRAYPEAIQLSRPAEIVEKLTGSARFGSVNVKSIAMSRLHTSILTNEPRGNLEACGFGGVGRLGSKQHTQYSFSKVGGLENQTITAVALGLDHTLALTSTGDVLSWGMNRFHQLGYVIEPTDASGKTKPAIDSPEYQIQTAPKRVIGPLRKEVVIGIAACKTASVCWTADDLYTWGTNSGQLGYTKGTPGWQILPRKVATVSKIEGVAISDIAMVCLLRTKELICFWNDSHFRIQFSPSVFPHRYKPPQALSRVTLAKVTCNDSAFAALSTSGEVFLFSLPDNPTPESSRDVRPQRVWTLRRSVAAARDVALGADGTIIVCTASGHVFVHAPKPVKGSGIAAGSGSGLLSTSYRTHKYQRVAGLTRVVAVAANSTGGFAALRADAKIDNLVIEGKSLAEALGDTQPYLAAPHDTATSDSRTVIEHGDDEDEEKEGIIEDVALARRLCSVVVRAREIDGPPSTLDHHILHGADMRLSGAINLPVHRAVILARSSILGSVLSGKSLSREGLDLKYSEVSSTLTIRGCHPLSVLVFLNYLYSDQLCAIWDSRIGRPIADSLSDIDAQPNSIRLDLQRFARVFDLPALRHATDTLGKRTPAPTLNADFAKLFYSSQPPERPVARHDICLELADRSVFCHSVVLRARSPFFASFFDEPEWTSRRWDEGGVMVVDMKHLEWRSMEYVFRYMCGGEMTELFDGVGFVNSADEFIDFVFQVMAAANELMLEQLTEICSTVILRHITLNNCTTVLTDASPFYSPKLKAILHKYIAVNMESLLEKRTLDSLAHDTMKSLAAFARAQQAIKSPHTRSGAWIAALMDRHKEWLEMQDFPAVVVRSGPPGRQARTSPKLSPMGPTSPKTPRRISSFTLPPTPQRSGGARPNARHDEMFTMDEEGTGTTEALSPARAEQTAGSLPDLPPPASSPTPISNQVWKGLGATKAERVDMRSIMANEAASSKPNRSPLVRITGFETTSQPASPSKTPQKERAQVSSRQPTQVATPPASASSSWRDPPSSTQRPNARPGEFPSLSESGTNARPRIALTPTPGPSPSSVPKPSAQPTNAPRPPRAPPVQAPLPPPAFPGLGPVIIPKRSTSGTENPRRRNASEAWTAPPPMPAPAPGPSGQVSFSEIQQQQNAQKSQHAGGKSKRSLLEIQAEEAERARVLQEQELARAREAEDLAAEMEFMQWWHAEEARVKKEMEGGKGGGGAGKGRRKGRGTAGKKNKGNQGSGPGPKTVASTTGP